MKESLRSPEKFPTAYFSIFLLTFLMALAGAPRAQVNVTTYHNDISRSGQNTREVYLNPGNVSSSTFGKLFTVPVDGYVFAQPLYLAGVSIAGGTHNVLYVATEHDSVYAIDADSGAIYWHDSLIPAGGRTIVGDTDIGNGCNDIVPEIGITGTPVIDPVGKTLYVVAASVVGGKAVQYLHALDIVAGGEKLGGPVSIQATVPGNGYDSVNNVVTFSPLNQNQRTALLLENGHVVMGFGSHCDYNDWHGWVMSYNATTLAQEAVFNSTPNGNEGGVWMGGGGVASDANGNLYFATGNGDWAASGTSGNFSGDFGDSVVKLGPPAGGSFPVLDFFTPWDQASLDSGDIDVASSGPLLLPPLSANGEQLLVQMGKLGTMYLLNSGNLGQYCIIQTPACTNGDTQIPQEIPLASSGVWGTPAYWNGSIYYGGQNDSLQAFSFNTATGQVASPAASQSPQVFGFPAPTPSISSNGTSNGIVWALDGSAYDSTCTGGANCQVLYAYNANNLGNLLYSSNQAPNFRDVPGSAVKFATPTVTNGKVYVGSQYAVSAYGLLTDTTGSGTVAAAPVLSPAPGNYNAIQSVTLSDTTPGAVIYYTTNGTTPTLNSSVYSGAITVGATTTIQAIAAAPNYTNSAVTTGTYSLSAENVNTTAIDTLVGIVSDGVPVTGGGIDYGNNAYSANLLGPSQTWSGQTFTFAAAGTKNVAQQTTIPLPAGSYYSVSLLATAVNGAQTNQTFTVNYSDGTNSTFTQSLSDWTIGPQGYAGESIVSTMAYHDNGSGTTTPGPVYLYGYTFVLNSAKSVLSLTLPNNPSVVVLAVNVSPNASASTPPMAPAPSLSPAPGAYSAAQLVSLADSNSNAVIYYTTNGSLPSTNSTPYTAPFTIATTATVNAIAVAPGLANSTLVSGTYTITYPTTVATPTFAPTPGAYQSAQSVLLSDSTAGSSIYYTTNGATPSVNSTLYSGPIAVNSTTTIKAIAVAPNANNSAVGGGTYSIGNQQAVNVGLTGIANVEASVTDGTSISGNGIDFSGNAYSANLLGASLIWSNQLFTFLSPGTASGVAQTTIPLTAGSYQTVSLLGTATDGAQTAQAFTVTYTDGTTTVITQSLSDWTLGPQGYAGESTALTMSYHDTATGGQNPTTTYLYGYSFAINAAKTVASLTLPNNPNVVILAVNLVSSSGVTPVVATPTFSPTPGTYATAQSVVISDSTAGASIYYTNNGSTPSPASTLYTGPIAVNSSTITIKAIATLANYTDSAVATGTYTITPASGGTFSLTPSKTSVILNQSQSGSDSFSVSANGGFTFTSPVTFSASGLPAGTAATFTPVTGTYGANLTLAVAATTPAGTYPVTVTGVSGGVTSTSVITLTVNPATSNAACPTTLASLDGWYGLLVSGATTGAAPAPKYLAGALLFNGTGGVAGNNVYSGAGLDSAATGSYVVNADCTLTVTLNIGSAPAQTYTVGITTNNEAVGIETDGSAVATIDLQAQYSTVTTGLNFTNSSLNGTYAVSCLGPQGAESDLNLVTFSNGTLSGTDPYNNGGSFATSNVPYTGSYAVNSDGSFSGSLTVLATNFDFYGVLSNSGTEVEYIYSGVSNGAATAAFASCSGGIALQSASAPGFTLKPAASNLTLQQNQGGTDAITVTPINGFTGTVSLSVSGLPAGASSAFSGDTLVVFVPLSTPMGTYPLTITGVSGSTTATTTVDLVVTAAAAFTLTPASASVSLTAGASGTDAITITPSNGFAGTVSFSASGLPVGATATFTPASSASGASLTLSTSAATPNGTSTITITGTAAATGTTGAFTETTTVSLIVGSTAPGSFTLVPGATTVTAVQGQSATDAVTITPINGFTGTVSFSASGLPAGATATFAPASSTSGTTLTLATAPTTPTGTTQFTVTGTSGSLVVTTTVNLTVSAAATGSFTLSSGASAVGLIAGGASSTVNLTVTATGGFNQTVSFAASGLPSGVSASFASQSGNGIGATVLTLTASSAAASGTTNVTLTASGGGITQSAPIAVTVSVPVNGTTQVNIASVANVYAIANNGSAPPDRGFDNDDYAYSASLLGSSVSWSGETFALGKAGAPSAASSTSIPLPAGNYSSLRFLGAAANGAQVNQNFVVTYTDGSTTTLTQSLSDWALFTAFNGQSTVLTMSYRVTPSGATQNGSINVFGYSIALNSTKTVKSLSLPNNRNVVILAVDLSGAVTVAPGFTLAPAAGSLTVVQGTSGTDAIAVTPSGGFTGTVSFGASGLPSGAAATFSPASSTTGATLSVSAAAATSPGNYTVTISGTSGSTKATTTVQLTVSAAPTPIVPYVFVNGIWTQTAAATVSPGATVDLGPQPLIGGSWSWAGPNGYNSTARQINDIPLSVGVNTYVATYTNTQGAKSTQTFTITVTAPPGFSLASKSTTVTVTPPTCFLIFCSGGVNGTDVITVAPGNGFNGKVTFTVSGLPSGVTASFNPSTVTATGSTTLTLTPSSTAAKGKSTTVTVTGSSGSGASLVTAKTSFTLQY